MDEQQVELIDYLKVIWKWKGLIAGGTLLVTAVAFVVSLFIPRMYEGTVTLLVTESKIPSAVGQRTRNTGFPPETVAGIIRNKSLAEKVIEEFGLDKGRYNVRTQDLLDNFVSVTIQRQTSLIALTVSFPDAVLARDMANFLAEQAVELNTQLNRADTVKTRDYIKAQRDDAQVKMERAQTKLLRFRRGAHLARLRREVEVLLTRMSNLENKYANALNSIEGDRAELKELSEQISRQPKVETIVKSIEKEPIFFFAPPKREETSISDLLNLQMKTEELNPVYKNTEQALIQTRGRLASLEVRRDDFTRRLQETEKGLADSEIELANKESHLEELTRNYTLARDAYLLFAKKLVEASLWVASGVNDLKIVDPAVTPRDAVKSRVILNVALAGTLGLMMFTFLAFFLEYLEKARGDRVTMKRSEN